MPTAGISIYQEAQARELDQGTLILMMYSGAIRFCDRALEAGLEDVATMDMYISRAKNVVLELMSSLDFEKGGEMAELLMRMYRGMFVSLQAAYINDDTAQVAEVRNALAELEESWRQVFAGDEYRAYHRSMERNAVA